MNNYFVEWAFFGTRNGDQRRRYLVLANDEEGAYRKARPHAIADSKRAAYHEFRSVHLAGPRPTH